MYQSTKQSVKKEQSILVISTYPPKGVTHHKSVLGGASYTKNMLINLRDEISAHGEKPQITVLAQKIDDNKSFSYQDDGIAVYRLWERNSLLTFITILKYILTHSNESKNIMVQLELTSFGNSGLYLALVAPFLFLLRLLNKNITLVYHEVIEDINSLAAHVNLPEHSWKTSLMNLMLKLYYRTTLLLSHKAIVFEEVLKQRLGNNKKVTVIPIAVEEVSALMTKEQARKKLGIPQNKFVIMTFGFLAWYKGTDWLVEHWSENEADAQLIIAGGINPNRASLPFYQKYVENLTQTCQDKNILLTGFVSEAEMTNYFLAADAIIFPYRTLMSSSAVVSLAFSYQKPLLFSKPMKQIFMTKDIKDVLKESNLSDKEIMFPLTDEFSKDIAKLQKNPKLIKKVTNFSQKMSCVRSWKHIRKDYYAVLFGGAR